jgi:hypothetical protein
MVDLARSAWWAIRQALQDGSSKEPEVQRFFSMFERVAIDAPEEAAMLTATVHLLQRSVREVDSAVERRQAIIEAVLHTPGGHEILVMTRHAAAAAMLRCELAILLDLPIEELGELGIHVQSYRVPAPDPPVGIVIAAGYFGHDLLEAVLASRATTLHFVFDPIEARTAWFGVKALIEFMARAGIASVAETLEQIAAALALYAPAFVQPAEISLTLNLANVPDTPKEGEHNLLPSTETGTIYLTDGTWLDIGRNAYFETIATVSGRSRIVTAAELKPGDHIVLLNDDTHALFSERRMEALDKGPLRDEAEQRITWLTIIRSVYHQSRPNLRAVVRYMAERGESIDYATVRSWVTLDDSSTAAVPQRRSTFLAFAEAIGIHLPTEYLLELFDGIRRWRILHRKAGRTLARVIRAARSNRLDATTLAHVERDWGLNARQLLQAARVAIVDEVIFPNEVPHASHER